MSALELFGRPYVVFNPSSKDHRSYYHDFVLTASWGRCPVRFLVTDDHGDLVTMIQRSLVKFYVEKEFKTGGRVRQMVAKRPPRRLTSVRNDAII